jgi:hypothetical protein
MKLRPMEESGETIITHPTGKNGCEWMKLRPMEESGETINTCFALLNINIVNNYKLN